MKYDFDILVIGLGPAGMAVSIMASEMGLNVLAIEQNKIGGECMNVGCIPAKALIRLAKKCQPHLAPFKKIQDDLDYIGQKKTKGMFSKVTLKFGHARFVDSHRIEVNNETYSAKNIFIATGTAPAIAPIDGLRDLPFLTNESMFHLDSIPSSMTIIGGGAIGCEMAQAFSQLGSKINIVHMDAHLLPVADQDAGHLLEEELVKKGITIHNKKKIKSAQKNEHNKIIISTEDGVELESEKLLIAAGRKAKLDDLNLEKAGVEFDRRGIKVNNYLQTNIGHIYAVGDINGHFLLSHAAMHQGMIALMNSMTPKIFRKNFKKFVVPWTVFTDPQVSHVGKTKKELDQKNIKYEMIEAKYEDYGAAIAEDVPVGRIKVYASPTGKIYGVSIVGEGSGEMINEWALAIQENIRLHKIMMLQHSFPTMGFLSKRVSEIWMMKKMQSPLLKKVIRTWYKIKCF